MVIEIKRIELDFPANLYYKDGLEFNGEHLETTVNLNYFITSWILGVTDYKRVSISTNRRYSNQVTCYDIQHGNAKFKARNPVNKHTFIFSVCKSQFERVTGVTLNIGIPIYYRVL